MLTQASSLKTHDPDAYQKLEDPSPEGLPESLNISSDIEIVPLPQDSDKPQLKGSSPLVKLDRPLYSFDFGKSTDVWSQWGSQNDAASSTLAPSALGEESPDSKSASKSNKKPAKKGKKSVN